MPPIGISIHIGVDRLERSRYPAAPALQGCENDAAAMERLAHEQRFATEMLLGPQATAPAVKAAVADAAAAVGSDGILLLTFAGHGGFVPNLAGAVEGFDADAPDAPVNDPDDEADDETWCLYDRQLLDDELYRLWALFPPGARILVVSDSCHSGDMIRYVRRRRRRPRPAGTHSALRGGARRAVRVRALTHGQAVAEVRGNAGEYRELQDGLRCVPVNPVEASVLLISAAEEWEKAHEADGHGLFTAALLEVWDGARFQGGHLEFHEAIFKRLQGVQSPGYKRTGVPSPAFEAQRPFTIDPPDAATMPQK